MNYDLHIHSTFSDGELTPCELLNLCHKKNISILSITDHNNLLGAKQALKENIYSDITVIPGIELSAKSPSNIQIHILGYNMNLEDSNLNYVCKEIMKDSNQRIKSLISELKRNYSITFKDDDIKEVFSSYGNIGRPEIAKLCLKYGYAKSVKDAFTFLLNPIKNKVVKKKFELTDKECIKCIIEAGGIASLAHPVTLNKDDKELKKYIQNLANEGLEAVEVYHSNNPNHLTNHLLQITNQLNLFQSIGSDYHGPIVSPNVELGKGKNNNILGKDANIITKLLEEKSHD